MKSSIVAALVALIFTLGGQAQQAAPKEHSMTGCLKKGAEANTYMLTDVEGSGPKTIGVVSSSANLAPHVSHKIEVTGTAVPAGEAEADKNVPKAQHYMKFDRDQNDLGHLSALFGSELLHDVHCLGMRRK